MEIQKMFSLIGVPQDRLASCVRGIAKESGLSVKDVVEKVTSNLLGSPLKRELLLKTRSFLITNQTDRMLKEVIKVLQRFESLGPKLIVKPGPGLVTEESLLVVVNIRVTNTEFSDALKTVVILDEESLEEWSGLLNLYSGIEYHDDI